MRTSAGKKTAPLQSTVHLIVLCFICLSFGTCYAKTKCLIGSVLALKCSLWYVIGTFVTNFIAFVRVSAYHASKVNKVVRKRYSMKKTDGQATKKLLRWLMLAPKQKLMRM